MMLDTTLEPAPAQPGVRRITVLAGGPGPEREVSLQSGAAIAAALRARGHEVFVEDIDAEHLAGLDREVDLVFPALHGAFGEDGALQRILEARGTRFVGSGAAASALAIDKVASKRLALAAGVQTPEFEVVGPADLITLKPPLVIKPIDQGSSVSTFVVREQADIAPMQARVCARFGRALAEQFVEGDELTVGIVGERVLPPICVRPRSGFYDYAAKYQADDTEYLFDTGLPASLIAQVQEWSQRVFLALGCRHLARVDWIADRAGGLWFLEINTLPGFTSHSLLPKAAARAGIGFEDLCERLVAMSLETHA